jgi:hypothetical protein
MTYSGNQALSNCMAELRPSIITMLGKVLKVRGGLYKR